jgi:hypothetical protein
MNQSEILDRLRKEKSSQIVLKQQNQFRKYRVFDVEGTDDCKLAGVLIYDYVVYSPNLYNEVIEYLPLDQGDNNQGFGISRTVTETTAAEGESIVWHPNNGSPVVLMSIDIPAITRVTVTGVNASNPSPLPPESFQFIQAKAITGDYKINNYIDNNSIFSPGKNRGQIMLYKVLPLTGRFQGGGGNNAIITSELWELYPNGAIKLSSSVDDVDTRVNSLSGSFKTLGGDKVFASGLNYFLLSANPKKMRYEEISGTGNIEFPDSEESYTLKSKNSSGVTENATLNSVDSTVVVNSDTLAEFIYEYSPLGGVAVDASDRLVLIVKSAKYFIKNGQNYLSEYQEPYYANNYSANEENQYIIPSNILYTNTFFAKGGYNRSKILGAYHINPVGSSCKITKKAKLKTKDVTFGGFGGGGIGE